MQVDARNKKLSLILMVVVEDSRFSKVELRTPKVLVHEQIDCAEGQTADNNNNIVNLLCLKNIIDKFSIVIQNSFGCK